MNVLGVVTTFDDGRGDGVLLSDGGEVLYFHCVSLVDGTRHVDPGTRISARRAVGHRGRDEVISLEQLH